MPYRNYHLVCKCGAFCWSSGSEDPDTNSAEYDPEPADWEGGDENCPHEDYICDEARSEE